MISQFQRKAYQEKVWKLIIVRLSAQIADDQENLMQGKKFQIS